MATVKAPADVAGKVNKPNWQLIVHEATGMKFSTFHKNKDDSYWKQDSTEGGGKQSIGQ